MFGRLGSGYCSPPEGWGEGKRVLGRGWGGDPSGALVRKRSWTAFRRGTTRIDKIRRAPSYLQDYLHCCCCLWWWESPSLRRDLDEQFLQQLVPGRQKISGPGWDCITILSQPTSSEDERVQTCAVWRSPIFRGGRDGGGCKPGGGDIRFPSGLDLDQSSWVWRCLQLERYLGQTAVVMTSSLIEAERSPRPKEIQMVKERISI